MGLEKGTQPKEQSKTESKAQCPANEPKSNKTSAGEKQQQPTKKLVAAHDEDRDLRGGKRALNKAQCTEAARINTTK